MPQVGFRNNDIPGHVIDEVFGEVMGLTVRVHKG